MQKLVFRNPNGEEIDFTSGDFGVTRWEGFSHTDMEVQSQQVPFHDGSVFLDALLAERELSITVAVNDGGDLEKRYRLKRELIHCLNPKLGEGELIYTNDYTSKKIVCVPAIPEFENKNMNDRGTLKASCSFTASSPYWEDVEETEIDLGKGFVEIENKGDIETSMKIDAYTNEIKNFRMKNLTNNKEISFSKTVNDNFIIDTNFGKKSVVKNTLSWEANSFNVYSDRIKFIDELNLFARFGPVTTNSLILFGYDLKKWEASRFSNNVNGRCCDLIWFDEGKKFIICDNTYIYSSPDGKTWTKVSNNNYSIQHLCYCKEFNLIIGFGYSKIYTSPDGINWTEVYTTNTSRFDTYCYSADLGLFLILGPSKIFTSTDGTNWTENSTSLSFESNIDYYSNLNLFLASYQNKIYKSEDGINWELYHEANINFSLKIIYDSYLDLYISFYYHGTSPSYVYEIYTSTDLENWTLSRTLNENLNCLIFCESLNLIIGLTRGGNIITSPDGINWDYDYLDNVKLGSMATKQDFVYSEELEIFVSVGGKIEVSKDGKTWTRVYDVEEILESLLMSICYSADLGLFVAVGVSVRTEKKGIVFTSPDGINWTKKFIDYTCKKICYSEDLGLFVAVGSTPEENPGTYDYKGVVYTSPDGINWDYSILSNLTECRTICYSHDLEKFVGAGYYYEDGVSDENEWYIMTSPDGINWTFERFVDNEPEENMYGIDITDICYSEKLNMFLMVGSKFGSGYIMTSPDGINWEFQTHPTIPNLYSICFSNYLNLFVVVDANIGLVMTSPDGKTWKIEYSPLYTPFYSICYSEKLNMFVGGDKIIIYSKFNSTENIIDYLTEDSDMNFNFSVGKNNLIISGNGNLNAKLKYTQKYLGV